MNIAAIAILAAAATYLAYVALDAHERIVGLEYRLSRARCAAWAYREVSTHYAVLLDIPDHEWFVDAHAGTICARDGDDLTAADLAAEASGRPHDMETR